jgi:hypothetical protein
MKRVIISYAYDPGTRYCEYEVEAPDAETAQDYVMDEVLNGGEEKTEHCKLLIDESTVPDYDTVVAVIK